MLLLSQLTKGTNIMSTFKTDDIVAIVEKMADVIIANEVYFCELDSPAGDGDFGMSVAKGFKQLKKEWADLSKDNIGSFLKDSGMIIMEYCGGASGPIWGSAFRSAAKTNKGKTEIDLDGLADSLISAYEGIQKRGGAKLGDKTLLDALIPAAEALKANASEEVAVAVTATAKAAVDGAEKTKEIVARKGRASYLGERSLQHPDAGATAIGIIFTEIAEMIVAKG
jgi:phosphoenolpyruvate---glycerone phosphotransferase subunit DhaL